MPAETLAAFIVIVFLAFFAFCVLFAGALICIGAVKLLRWLWTHLA